MAKLVNRAKMTTATTGTGTVTLGAAVAKHQSFADAGVLNGEQVRYVIEDGDLWEIGLGTYSSTGPTLTRGATESSSSGSEITLTGEAVVYVTAAETDIVQLDKAQTLTNKTIADIVLTGSIQEETASLSGSTPALNPANGTITYFFISSGTNPVFTDGLASGESMILEINNSNGRTVTWPTVTWVNNNGSAPTLPSTATTVITFWKNGTRLLGALVGDGT